MDNTNLKIEREKTKAIIRQQELETVKEIIKNPVVEILLAYIVIESLQKEGIIPNLAGTVAEAGCITAVAYQQIAPLMPYAINSGTEIIKSLAGVGAKALPLLTAGA